MRARLLAVSRPGAPLWAATSDADALWRAAAARVLLQANQAPPVGGFQAARYFTYVFFALAISVVMVMIFLCSMHCYRRARRQRDMELRRMRAPSTHLPEVNIQLNEHPRAQTAPPRKALPIYDAVLVRHPDGSKEVAYAPELPARMLEPELSAAQKAALRRTMRIHSISRHEEGDPRSRRRRALSEAGVGRHSAPGHWERRHRHRAGDSAATERGAPRPSSRGTRQPVDEAGLTRDQLAASETGRIQPFFVDRDRGLGGSSAVHSGPFSASSDSDSEWDVGGQSSRRQRHPLEAGSGPDSGRRSRRRHREGRDDDGSGGGPSGRRHSRRHLDTPIVYSGPFYRL